MKVKETSQQVMKATNWNPEDDLLEESLDLYRQEMEKVLPEAEDDFLLSYHRTAKRKSVDYFLKRNTIILSECSLINTPTTGKYDAGNLDAAIKLQEIIEDTFLEILDLNWKRCEELCQEALDRVRDSPPSPGSSASSSSVRSPRSGTEFHGEWWSCMKDIRSKYTEAVGNSLHSKMLHVWLSYLNKRIEEDFQVLMKDAVEPDGLKMETGEKKEPTFPALSTSLSDVRNRDQSRSSLESPSESFSMQQHLRLQMTWGRIVVFWKYWIECRKETIEILDMVSVPLEVDDLRGEMSPTPHQDADESVRLVLKRIEEDTCLNLLPLTFPCAVERDIRSFRFLVDKFQEFIDMILLPEYVCTFDMNPCDIYQRITTFRTDMTSDMILAQPSESNGFLTAVKLLDAVKDGKSIVDSVYRAKSRPLCHLKDFLMDLEKASEWDKLSEGMRKMVYELTEEEKDWSALLADSLDALVTVADNVSDAIPQLHHDILQWSVKRDETIAELYPVIKKLHATTKNVAIAQTVSSSVGLVGGIIAMGGLILAPFTMGASLIPSAIAGTVVAGVGAATAVGASVSEIVIDKDEMKKAEKCLREDQVLLDGVIDQIKYLNRNSALLLRYIPEDELESFISQRADPSGTMVTSTPSKDSINPRIAVNMASLVSVGGKAVVMPISQFVMAGTVAASRVAVLAVAHSIAAIGIALDIINLVISGVKLGHGARSENAKKLEEIVVKLEEEKRVINDINLVI